MSSLNIINKAIDRASGTGLPFYAHQENIFSKSNNYFNCSEGLLIYPVEQVPVFQLFLPYGNKTSFEYLETKGGNNFTGTTFTPPVGTPKMSGTVEKDGDIFYIWQTPWNQSLVITPPPGRWVIKFVVNDGLGGELTYWSEEFITCDSISA